MELVYVMLLWRFAEYQEYADMTRLKRMGALKTREWTSRHEEAGVDNAGVKNAGVAKQYAAFADSAFPVLYALMSRKTHALYVKVFEKVLDLVPEFAPTYAMADFEEASVAAF